MSIILRTLKGSALTYEEMDRNLSQYFYSSSVHDSGTELRLHFTGSSTLDTVGEEYGATPSQSSRYHSITLGSGGVGGVTKIIAGTNISISPVSGVGEVTINSTAGGGGGTPAGPTGAIQFNNNGSFGGETELFYNNGNNRVGIGTGSPQQRLHIVGDSTLSSATIRLDSATTGTTKFARILTYNGSTQIGAIGKVYSDETASYISTYNSNKLHFEYNSKKTATVDGVGIGIFRENPNRALTVNGSIGISNDASTNLNQSIIQPIPSSIYSSGVLRSGANEYGLMVSPPLTTINGAGGHVVVSISEAGDRSPSTPFNSFAIVSSTNEAYASAVSVASFTTNQRAGIATNNPQVTLDVNGQIRGKFTTNASDTTALGFYTSKIVKAPITGDITFTATVAPAGTEATVIVVPSISTTNTVTFSSSNFKTEGTLTVSKSRTYTVSFVSDGSYWYETSRTTHLS